ncbi:LamB/YcsF family protein [Nocardioides nitrophenolicus]|uniref:LamB/YcsF family protein n=1 Tax=Nocardioides nitrophenolicus TaxID=60489 RepID=UPI001EF8A226|nr:5-oxoprolinase subunit PxpA [Nocardioides nitrophenolicus]MBM7516947.1 UPF0271 protein [Nocardioides nitrophenolicus]
MSALAATASGEAVRAIDLNCDVGEGYGAWAFGNDEALLDIVTSANIACGAHAGDPSTMRRTTELAVERGVAIGAHVGYPDRQGFGRRSLGIDHRELADEVLAQLGALQVFARAAGGRVAYVKPHGALYHADAAHAGAVLDAMEVFDPTLSLLAAPGSALHRQAGERGLEVVPEGFADRRYLADGRLAPRGEPGAVIDDPREAASQALQICCERGVRDIGGDWLPLAVASICVHSDTPGAVRIASSVVAALTEMGIACRTMG